MQAKLDSMKDFTDFVHAHLMCAVYFSGPDCSVCMSLKPKLFHMLETSYPQIALAEIDCQMNPDIAAQQTVFSIPTLIVFIDGRENNRKVRSFSLSALATELQRPYSLLMDKR